MQNKTKRLSCIRKTSHPMATEMGMLMKDALQEAIRLDDSKQPHTKGISLRSLESVDFKLFAN